MDDQCLVTEQAVSLKLDTYVPTLDSYQLLIDTYVGYIPTLDTYLRWTYS